MLKIFDAFIFAGELDMLEIRLNELNDVVDHFVIVEACEPHGAAGRREPTNPDILNTIIEPFRSKITYQVLDKLEPAYTDRVSGWARENFHRKALMLPVEQLSTSPDDIVIISDVDEIPRAESVRQNAASTVSKAEPVYFDMEMFVYNVDTYTTEEWKFAYMTTVKMLQVTGVQMPRGELGESRPTGVYLTIGSRDPDKGSAGWHFSSCFDLRRLREKLRTFAHSSDAAIRLALSLSDEQLTQIILSPRNIFTGKKLQRRSPTDSRLPKYLLDHPEKFKHLHAPDLPAQRPVEDVIMGAAVNYDWPALRPYARSIAWSGFKGAKVMFVWAISDEARTELTKLGFTLIDYQPSIRSDENRDYSYQSIAKDRYRPAILYLMTNLGRFRYVVWTGVRDAIMQTDPTVWLSENLAPSKIVVGGLGHPIKNCPYNSEWVQQSDPENYEWLKEHEAVCADTIAGEADSMLSLFQDMYTGIYKLSPPPVDQGVLNVLVRKSPYKEIIRVPRLEEGFTAQWWPEKTTAEPLEYFIPGYGHPHWIVNNAEAVTSERKPYSILHLYDRSPGWTKLVQAKYAFNIGNALKIDGFMSQTELAWLAAQASKRNLIVEIGSWMGRSTRALADNCLGKVLAVDTWKGSDEPGHVEFLKDKPEDYLVKKFLENMAGVNAYAYQLTSLEAAEQFKDESFDMIFIDAGHEYEDVKADILAWGPLVAEGGVLCGHDYQDGAPGVKKAVDELLDGVEVYDSIWYTT